MTRPNGRALVTAFGAGFADVGILLPVALALVALNGLDATTVLVGTGLMYLASGLYFRLPVPVQPLKAMAAIALATGAGADLLGAAGVAMGITLLMLSFPAPLRLVRALFPLAVVRGVQLGVGLVLLVKAVKLMTGPGADAFGLIAGAVVLSGYAVAMLRRWGWMVPLLLAACVGWVSATTGAPVTPLSTNPAWHGDLALSPQLLLAAFVTLVVPQLPLTLGNAVMATTRTARDYFGPRARRVTPKALCRSLGLGNIAIGLFGGMPVCHGSGGMSAHVRLGARNGLATALFGAVLIAFGMGMGSATLSWAHFIPPAVFGALLVPVGWAHAALARDAAFGNADCNATLVTLFVALTSVMTQNLTLGLAAGWGIIGIRITRELVLKLR